MGTPPVALPTQRIYAQPRLRLDDLLAELQSHLDAVMSTRDRMYRLLDAVVSIGNDLDLQAVLRRIIQVSVDLIDAQYGALGVVREDGQLSQFITIGIDEQQQERIGPLPHGHGLLGELIRHPVPLRLHDLTEHPSSYGFPENHPPMSSFLGVPIRVRDEVYGNLYFTEKRGGVDFDDADQSIVEALAAAAGIAISNARMYEATSRREQYLHASGQLTTSLLDDVEPEQMLQLLAQHSLELSGADIAAVTMPYAEGLVVQTALGSHSETLRGRVLPIDGSVGGRCFSTAKPIMTDQISREPDADPQMRGTHPYGPMIFVPLITPDGVLGVLFVARLIGGQPFELADLALLEGFSGQASVALERAQQRRELERMQRFEERDEIARGMHEAVVQRLFRSVMKLDGLVETMSPEQLARRAHEVSAELDETIKVIRDTIYELHPPDTL